MQSLRGKVAVITGSSSGIGAGLAEYFAKLGSRLSLTGRNSDNLEKTVSKTGLGQNDVLSTVGDLMKPEDRVNLIKRTVEKFGKIDILINNAGIFAVNKFVDEDERTYDDIMNTNLKSPFFLTQLAIPHLIKSKGNIVNISSDSSTLPLTGMSTYCMSKAAFDMFTNVLALEVGSHGVRVNTINPGYIDTGALEKGAEESDALVNGILRGTSVGRAGSVEEVAHVTAFLASDAAAFITGVTLLVDGGLHHGLGNSACS